MQQVEQARSTTLRVALGVRKVGLALAVAATTCAICSAPASAQNYPSRAIKIVVPFTAGGGSDVTTRLIAEQMTPKLGQPVIVENRPGASASVGAGQVAHAPPDGYTILVGT